MRVRGGFCIALFAAALAGCSGDAQQSELKKRPDNTPPAAEHSATLHDLSGMLPTKGRKHSGIVMDHVAGLQKLPGGTVADYEAGGKKYEIFLVDADTNQQAAFMLLDAKANLKDPEYLASFGGYFGSDGSRPVFVFARLRYLVGIVGLPKDDADPIARRLGNSIR